MRAAPGELSCCSPGSSLPRASAACLFLLFLLEAGQHLVEAAGAKALQVQGDVGVADRPEMLCDGFPDVVVHQAGELGRLHLDACDGVVVPDSELLYTQIAQELLGLRDAPQGFDRHRRAVRYPRR